MSTWRRQAVARLTRLYPLASGGANLANHRWVQSLAGSPSGQAWASVRGGEVYASLDDYIGRATYFIGDLDRKISDVCRRLLRPGDQALDIGANIGLVSLLMSRLVGPGGSVHAFEPNPRMLEAFKLMTERNGLTNVELHEVALGESDGELELHVPLGNAGAASLVRHYGQRTLETVSVPVRTLDDVVAAGRIDTIRLIKIDVEGFEPAVFRGARSLLSRQVPDAILFEFNERCSGPLAEQAVFRELLDCGYDFFALPKALLRTQVIRADVHRSGGRMAHDFIAAPRGERFEALARQLGVPG